LSVTLRLFAAAREAAGRGVDEYDREATPSVGALLDAATSKYGPTFEAVLATARVWVNGDEPADGRATRLDDGDEVAVLPPVSGG
jgi:sulfur-carrier protein